ncbi:MAG TPA: UDP-N-acetylglucosamine--N-acetylmuramyl-(pentapeptide) pyrophosphoryl-undecaprenol N-acetylglucosamine transferase [Acidimicrobiales bacterium]|nr:UDP-N-acetylglucosamine--N-acetylmuramyl-(pentapeptide) pyrophosphoryl-undecaprenol N-acetylglucosamine transferase [Acidimicrobiales bacterium]
MTGPVDRRTGTTYALVAGGGTGGHVRPAIAVARALVAAGHPAESIQFVGSARGLERTLVPEAGFAITLLPGRGLVRRMAWCNVGAVAGLAAAAVRAVGVVARRRPDVVFSVGGYASVACVAAAVLARIPVVVAEQNAVPGLANRLAGRFAAAAAVSFPGTPLPRAVVTGNPVPPEVGAVDRSPAGRAAARRELGLRPDGPLVAVSSGSLGARSVNRATVGLAGRWAGRAGTTIYHVVGERDAAEMAAAAPELPDGGLRYVQVPFERRMHLLYAAADVFVGRAGASTAAELTVAGVPAVVVPLPGAPGDHQTHNGRRLEEAGAAVVIPDAELDAARLEGVLDPLLADPARLEAMGEAARRLGHPEAAAEVAKLVEAHARRPRGRVEQAA